MTLRQRPAEIIGESTSPLVGIADWWERCELGHVAEVTNGAAFKSALFNKRGDGLPLIRIRDVGKTETSVHYSGDYDLRHVVERGDLVVGMDGDFRVARWAGGRALLNQRVCRLRVLDHSRYSDRFLEFVLQPYLDEIHKVTSSVTVKHLSSRTIQQLPIPLPPRAEQDRIVAAIDEHFSRLDAVESTLEGGLKSVAAMRLSLLTDAFKVDATLPHNWQRTEIGEIAKVQLGRQRSPQHHAGPQMRPYLRAANVTWSGLSLDDVKQMNFGEGDFETYRLRPGDLLLNEASGSPNEVGKPAVWNGEIANCCFQNTLLRLQARDINPGYLYWYCYMAATTGRFGEAARGVNIRHLGKQGLARFPIPVAPRMEQEHVVTRLREQFQQASGCEAAIQVALTRTRAFRRSILAKAFDGQLVRRETANESNKVTLSTVSADMHSRSSWKDTVESEPR